MTEGQESRGLVRGQGIAPSPLGFSPYACQYASRPHDATFSCASRRPGCRSHAGGEQGASTLPLLGSEPLINTVKGQEGNPPGERSDRDFGLSPDKLRPSAPVIRGQRACQGLFAQNLFW
jgi:hypothetical protein